VPADIRFEPGQTVVRRYWRQDRISFLQVATVLADDEEGLRLWLPSGSPFWRVVAVDGRTHHDAPLDELGEEAQLRQGTWSGTHVMMWSPPGENAYSVWWFFDAETADFDHWYVNLEAPIRRFAAGADSADHALDIRAYPDRKWEWKDEAELAAKTGHPGYWTAEEAAAIRAEGGRLAEIIEAGKFPFDGTWCDLRRPNPPVALELPLGWDGPRAV
jgi:Protein of unknown function (DUF402)